MTVSPQFENPGFLRETAEGVSLAVRAQPGAKKTAITGVYGEGKTVQLKIAVHAPPIEGRANEALIAFLAEVLSVPRRDVVLMSGDASRSKVFLVRGVRVEEVGKRLGSRAIALGIRAAMKYTIRRRNTQ